MSPRNEQQNAAIKDERREQILSVALKLFGKRGFAATKMSDVSKAAGVSYGLVYHYFSSKEEIFSELLKRAMSGSGETILMAERMQASPAEKIRMIAKQIMGALEDFEDTAYYFLIVTYASMMEEMSCENKRLIGESGIAVAAMVRILAEGQKTGEVKKGDPEEMAMVFFAAIQGLAMYKLTSPSFKMPDSNIAANVLLVL